MRKESRLVKRLRRDNRMLYFALRSLVNYNEADPDLYKGDDDHVLGRLMHQAKEALDQTQGE